MLALAVPKHLLVGGITSLMGRWTDLDLLCSDTAKIRVEAGEPMRIRPQSVLFAVPVLLEGIYDCYEVHGPDLSI